MPPDPPVPSPEELELPEEVLADVVEPSAAAFRRLVAVTAKLRLPGGCPWDAKQTHRSLAKHLLEETYEVLEAIEDDDLVGLREELGDLALQVVFHAFVAYQEDAFTVADVLHDLTAKLVRRHPHVFGDVRVADADEVLANWESIKREEKDTGPMDGVPRALPALSKASKLSRRAAQLGFDHPSVADARADVTEELEELDAELGSETPDDARVEAEFGDVLFALANLARKAGIEPESALRRSADVFAERFASAHAEVGTDGRDPNSLTPEEWKAYWDRAKAGRG